VLTIICCLLILTNPSPDQISKQSIETLLRYLSERRPQIDKALATHLIGSSQASAFPPLSITPTSELFDLPDLPFPSLAPAQLVHVAQIVYTALFKSYLVIRPGLLGPLCRTPNWCEVSEVEEELTARGVSLVIRRFALVANIELYFAEIRRVDRSVQGEEDAHEGAGPPSTVSLLPGCISFIVV
jgi:hypothetical protein